MRLLASRDEHRHVAAALLDLDEVAVGQARGRSVEALAVHEHVAVGDALARLVDRAGEARAQDDGVEATFEVLDQVVVGAPGTAGGLVERAAHLLLGDEVLGAQALLLAQPAAVLGEHVAGGAVLARARGTLVEDPLRLGRQGDAERPTQLAYGLVAHEVLLYG